MAAAVVALAVFLVHDSRPAAADHGDEETYWSATLTVKAWSHGVARGCSNVEASGLRCSAPSVLTDDDFTYGGASYDVTYVQQVANGIDFRVTFSQSLPATLKEVAVLYVDGVAHPLASATARALTGGGEQLEFSTSSVSWAADDTVTLALKRPAAPPSGVELSTETIAVTEGGSATFTVALSADPGTDATVTLLKTQFNQPGVGTDGHRWNTGGATVAPETLTFTAGGSGNWGTAQTVTVTAPQDDDSCSEQLVILILAPTQTYDYVYVGEGNGSYNLNAQGNYVHVGSGMGEYNYQAVDSYGSPGGTSSSVTGVSVTVADDDGGACGGV